MTWRNTLVNMHPNSHGQGVHNMRIKIYTDIHEFYQKTYDILMRHEAQNLVPLGNVIIGHKGEDKTAWRDPANWLMATVEDEKGVQLTALMTPPHNITLYATGNIINPAAIPSIRQVIALGSF